MATVEWKDVPERYWPDTEKPWRVTWGFGVFEDFTTEDEAQEFYEEMKRDHANLYPREPFNAIEV